MSEPDSKLDALPGPRAPSLAACGPEPPASPSSAHLTLLCSGAALSPPAFPESPGVTQGLRSKAPKVVQPEPSCNPRQDSGRRGRKMLTVPFRLPHPFILSASIRSLALLA